MNNYNYTRPPRKGVIVFVSFVFAAIFGIAFFSPHEQRTDLGHSVHVSPTSANYGTVSTARPQVLAVPMQSSAPMLSGGAIRSYAYSGHATMPNASSSGSGFKMCTTSSASVHSIGSGGGGGGGSMSGGSSSGGSSSKGIQYSGGSLSVPSLALTTPMNGSSRTALEGIHSRRGIGPRKALPTEPGEVGDAEWDDEAGKWCVWDPDLGDFGGWRYVSNEGGETRYNAEDDCIEYWNGSRWVSYEEWSNPGTPLGDAPWLWILLLAIAYVSTKVLRKRIESLSSITID